MSKESKPSKAGSRFVGKSDFEKTAGQFISLLDKNYPLQLRHIFDAPEKLYFKGNLELLKSDKLVTFVGSRKSSIYHQSMTEKIISRLNKEMIIVSGMAYGIDTISHLAALKNSLKTIAVLGSGLGDEVIYPKANLKLAKNIISSGGLLLSEHSDGEKPQLHYFAKRNRILAGLSKATVVISGKEKSGTLITAQCALDQNREVLALPGNINQDLCYGPNNLIRNGAIPLLSADDIHQVYGLASDHLNERIKFNNNEDAKIYALLQTEPLSLEKLAEKLDMDLGRISSSLTMLELSGLIRTNQNNEFEIT